MRAPLPHDIVRLLLRYRVTHSQAFGEYVLIRAEVANLAMLSAHADAGEILNWLGTSNRSTRETVITHGEPAALDALRYRITEQLGWSCRVPEYRETVVLS